MALTVGIDLCDDYTTICVWGGSGVTMIPTIVCRGREEQNTEESREADGARWYIGEEAYRKALAGGGVLTDKLLKLLKKDGTSTIYGRTYTAAELLAAFLRRVLALSEKQAGEIQSLSIALHTADRELMDKVREVAVSIGLRREAVHLLSHQEAFIYYALQQDKELYSNLVELFDLSDERLCCYELKVMRGLSRNTVVAEGRDLEEAFQIGILKTDSGRKLADRIMTGCARRQMGKKIVSSVFLTGRGFESTEWAVEFKNFICQRRRVLAEQGIFARGAALHAADRLSPENAIPYLMLCDTRTDYELSLPVVANNRPSQLILAAAGESWYDYEAHVEVIPYGQNYVELELNPVDKFGAKRALRLSMESFPKRPEKCTRVALSVRLLDARHLRLSLRDEGFGELFPKSGAELSEEIEI